MYKVCRSNKNYEAEVSIMTHVMIFLLRNANVMQYEN